MNRNSYVAAVAACLLCQPALGGIDLQITEMWPGNSVGADVTDDWFEVTNRGDMAWTAADGDLYFDDDSQDPVVADLISGVPSIAAGESVIFIDGGPGAELIFELEWGGVVNPLPQVGTYSGSGLSGTNGDGVTLFLDSDFNGPDLGEIIDFQSFPAGNAGASYDVDLGVFSTVGNSAGAVSAGLNDGFEATIGSPGSTAPVPEPTCLILASLGLIGLVWRRK